MTEVGHWDTLAEAAKLSNSVLQQGIVETIVEGGQLLPLLPVKQISGSSYLYNREDSWSASSGADFYTVRQQIPWTSDVTYTQVTATLKQIIRQDPLDKFVAQTYNNINDYRAVKLTELAKRMSRFMEHAFIYGDVTYGGAKEFDGLHALAEENAATLDIDGGETAPSYTNLRALLDACKVDTQHAKGGRQNVIILMPRILGRFIDASVQEASFVRTNATHSLGYISYGQDEFGKRITYFDGIPIVRSDFLVAEQANTGAGSNKRAAHSSGTAQYSIFVIRFGQSEDGGLSLCFGGGMGPGMPFERESFDKLEDFNSGGERLVSYLVPLLGAGYCLGRIYDVTGTYWTP